MASGSAGSMPLTTRRIESIERRRIAIGSDDQEHPLRLPFLRLRHVHRRLGSQVPRLIADVADDPGYASLLSPQLHPGAHSAFGRAPVLSRQALVHEDHVRGIRVVAVAKIASRDERDARRATVARCHEVIAAAGIVILIGGRPTMAKPVFSS